MIRTRGLLINLENKMSQSIYDLSAKELELKSMLFALDETNPEDTEKIALIERQLDAIDESANRKILWRVRVLKELQASLEAVEERKRAIEKKRTIAQNAVERMKQNIANCFDMFPDLDGKAQDEEFSVSYKLNGATAKVIGLENIEIKSLPRDLWSEKVIISPNLNAIKALLKTGTEINGLSLDIGKTLRI